jgi:hypothetical protein
MQAAAEHVAIVCGALAPGHAPPHTPQLSGSVCKFTSHPSDAFALQSANPVAHDTSMHALLAHVLVACGTVHE